MSDYIERFGDQAMFASLRQPGWHALGTVFNEEIKDYREFMEVAGLNDWDVRLIPVDMPGVKMLRQAYLTVRTNPWTGEVESLGITGKRYSPFQNEQVFELGQPLVDEGVARWETAGSVKDGRQVFGSLSIDREIVLDPTGVSDTIKNYLLLSSSHDGSLAVTAANTPVRVVCSNTLSFALSGAAHKFALRHTRTLEDRVAFVADALSKAHGYIDRFEGVAQQLVNAKVTEAQWAEIVQAWAGKPDHDASKRAQTVYANNIDTLEYLRASETNSMWKGTAWGAVNTLTEQLDWFRTGRGDNKQDNLAAARAGFDPVVQQRRQDALSIVAEVVSL